MNTVGDTSESKVARHERIKGSANPWDTIGEILAGADRGPDGISKEDCDVRLRWWGVYPQGDGQGVRGGSTEHFMVRIRIPGGRLSSDQFRAIGRLSAEYGQGSADITVRQNIQIHWVKAVDLRPFFEGLWAAGLTSQGACGDDTRNITSCPVSDLLEGKRALDQTLLEEINGALNGNPVFYNLPRKFKITFAGCPCGCTYPEINDVGILPVVHPELGEGYALRVGGGLATRPHLSLLLPRFFPPDKVVPSLVAIATLFRDRDELRQSRERARLKFLFLEHGWTVDRFTRELEAILGEPLPDSGGFLPPGYIGRTDRDHLGLHPQEGADRYFAGLSVSQGVLTPDSIARIASWADLYGSGEVRLTPQQNLVIPGLDSRTRPHLERLIRETEASGERFSARTVSCTGKTFCRLALAETKEMGGTLARMLDERFPAMAPVPFLHLSGCPNDCGQMRIADIGLSGIQGKNGDQGSEDGFELLLGGSMQGALSFNKRTGVKLMKEQVAPFLTRMIAFYQESCQNGEDFRSFIERVGFDWVSILDKGSAEDLLAFSATLPGGPREVSGPA